MEGEHWELRIAAQHTVARALSSVPCKMVTHLDLVLASQTGQAPSRYSHCGLATEGKCGTEYLRHVLVSVEFGE